MTPLALKKYSADDFLDEKSADSFLDDAGDTKPSADNFLDGTPEQKPQEPFWTINGEVQAPGIDIVKAKPEIDFLKEATARAVNPVIKPLMETPAGGRFTQDIGAGTAGMVSGALNVLPAAEAFVGIKEPVGRKMSEYGTLYNQLAQDLQPEDPNALDALIQAAPSVAGFFIPGLAVARGVEGLAAAGSFAAKAAPYLGQSAMTVLESLLEGGSVFQDRKDIVGEKQAATEAAKTTAYNVGLLAATNYLSGFFKGGRTAAMAALKAAPWEGIQEAGQEVISALNKGEKPNMRAIVTSGAIGAIMGGGMGALDVQAAPERAPQAKTVVNQAMTPEMGGKPVLAIPGTENLPILPPRGMQFMVKNLPNLSQVVASVEKTTEPEALRKATVEAAKLTGTDPQAAEVAAIQAIQAKIQNGELPMIEPPPPPPAPVEMAPPAEPQGVKIERNEKPVRTLPNGLPDRKPGSIVSTMTFPNGEVAKIKHSQVIEWATNDMRQALEEYEREAKSFIGKDIPIGVWKRFFTSESGANGLDITARNAGMEMNDLVDLIQNYSSLLKSKPPTNVASYYNGALDEIEFDIEKMMQPKQEYDDEVPADWVVAEKGASYGQTKTDTPEFKNWFGNSVVTDTGKPISEGGKPLRVYHWTIYKFDKFSKEELGKITENNIDPNDDTYGAMKMAKAGFWFSNQDLSIKTASDIGMPVYLSLKNPKMWKGDFWNLGRNISKIKKEGYDGIIVKDAEFGGISYVAFSPTQIKSVFNRGTFDPENPNILMEKSAKYGGFEPQPIWFSQVENTITEKMPEKASGDQVLGLLKNSPGIKQEELDWIGLPEFLQGKKSVTKQEVQDFIRSNNVDVQEVIKSDTPKNVDDMERLRGDATKFSKYTLPGGENYRELLLTLQNQQGLKPGEADEFHELERMRREGKVPLDKIDRYNELSQRAYNDRQGSFKSSHFFEPNILAHVRFNDRTDADGNKVLFIEEIQSDWHQKGRDQGYAGEQSPSKDQMEVYHDNNGWHVRVKPDVPFHGGDNYYNAESRADAEQYLSEWRGKTAKKSGVPDAPFKKTWHELALKRMLRYAAENGYDKIAWTTGEQQAERYDLSKQIDSIGYREDGGLFSFEAYKGSTPVIEKENVRKEELSSYVGKEMAKKMADGIGETDTNDDGETFKVLSGLDLKVGGEGMKGFYDQMIPSFMNKYAKKWGGRVGETQISQIGDLSKEFQKIAPKSLKEPIIVHSIDITPSMKESVMQGQALFEKQPEFNFGTINPYEQVKIPGTSFSKKDTSLPEGEGGVVSNEQSLRRPPRSIYDSQFAVEYRETGSLKIPGHKISTPQDLGFIFKGISDPTRENSYLALLKNGKVIHIEHIAVGTIDWTLYPVYEVVDLMNRSGADSVVASHNHPSGEVNPSDEDLLITSNIRAAANDAGIKFLGHAIINDTTFGFIDKNGTFSKQTHKEYAKTKTAKVLQMHGKWIKRETHGSIFSEQAAYELFKGLQVGKEEGIVIALDTQNRIRNIAVVPHGQFDAKTMQKLASDYRVNRLITVNSYLDKNQAKELQEKLIRYEIKLLDDVLETAPNHFYSRRGAGEIRALKEEGELFGAEKENIADRYERLIKQAQSQGMSFSEARKWAQKELAYSQKPTEKAEFRSANPKQDEFSIGKGRRGEGELFSKGGNAPIDFFEEGETPEVTQARKKFKLADRSLEIIRKFANRVGEKYQPRGAVGSFNPNTTNIRVNSLNNISTVTHEVVHFLDNKFHFVGQLMQRVGTAEGGNPIYDSKYRRLRKELTNAYLEYYPGASKDHKLSVRLKEGLAALIQNYVQSPTSVRQRFPHLLDSVLGNFHESMPTPTQWNIAVSQFLELIDDVRSISADYQALNANDKIGARVAETFRQEGKKLPYMSNSDYMKEELIDDVYPIKRLAEEYKVAGTIKDPADWIRIFNVANSIVFSNLKGKLGTLSKMTGVFKDRHGFWIFRDGEPVKVADFNWMDMERGLKKAGLKEQFRNWLIARDQHFNHLELDKRKAEAVKAIQIIKDNKNGMLDEPLKRDELIALQKTVESYKNLRDLLSRNRIPRELATQAYMDSKDIMAPYAEMFDTFTKSMVELSSEAGLITPEQRQEYLSKEGYAPMKRDVFDDITAGEGRTPSGGKSVKPSSMKARKGSELPIIDPLYSFPHDMAEIFRKSLKQISINKIADVFGNNPESGLAERQELKPMIDEKTGIVSYPQDRDPNILMARDANGRRVPYLVNKELKTIIEELLDYRSADILARFLRSTGRIFTASTTGLFPLFAAMNVVSDQIQASSNSVHKTIPFFDAVRVLRKVLFDHNSPEAKYAAEYLAMGGERQTIANAMSLPPEEFDAWLNKENKGVMKLVDWLDTGSEILGFPSKVSELSTRMVEYIRSRMNGKAYVNSLEDAGTVTGPFHHKGRLVLSKGAKKQGSVSMLETTVKSIPFFSASTQALAVGIESLKGSRGADVQKRAAFVALATLAAAVASSYWIKKKATDEQKKLYSELSATELAGYIWLPSSDGKSLIKIKMHGPVMAVSTLINMAMWQKEANYYVGDYTDAATAWLPDQINVTDPSRLFFSWLPQAIKPILEVATNTKTWPNARPLESAGMKNREPKYRYTEYTPAYAKWLGDKMNLSPIQIDHLVEGYGGRGTRPFLGKEMRNPFVREFYLQSARTIQDYYDDREKTQQHYESIRKNRADFTYADARDAHFKMNDIKNIDAMLKRYREMKEDDKDRDSLRDTILEKVSTFMKPRKIAK